MDKHTPYSSTREYKREKARAARISTPGYRERERLACLAWSRANKAPMAEYKKNYNRLNRERVIGAYGGCCACCGEKQFEFLTVDHVNNNGAEHRRKTKMRGNSFLRWIIKNGFPKDLQILCANCNNAKGRYKICPHEVARRDAANLEAAQ